MSVGHRAVLALGANLGDAAGALQQAVDLLRDDPQTQVDALSRVYVTAPVGGPPQPDYVNAAVAITTTRTPEQLLALAHDIEQARGREREVVWGPRTLDVDIIVVDEVVSDDPALTLPHPRSHERAFVLQPWLDVAPGAVHPLRGSVAALLASVSDQSVRPIDELVLR